MKDIKQSPNSNLHKKPERPVTCIIIGAGQRGKIYAEYAERQPDEWKVVAVADPSELRRKNLANKHGIPEENCFSDWEDALAKGKIADVAVISTSDSLHYEPAMKAIELGYDLLLEKVIAQSWEECNTILQSAKKHDVIVAVAHVLRYSPYFRKLKDIVDSGAIGDIVNIQHMEPIEQEHMSHSYVRGNWGNTSNSTPILLSKSCHDLDILRWIMAKPCKKVTSFGGLYHFRKERAPEGATPRCTDGCPVERDCPHSAIKTYMERKKYPYVGYLDVKDENDNDEILEKLKTGPYGRCVYHCDNDAADHQVVNMEFEGGSTVSFTLDGLTSYEHRRTRIMGTKGDIVGDGHVLEVTDFNTRETKIWDVRDEVSAEDLMKHGGGDIGIVQDLVQAISQKDPSFLTSTLDVSMESHKIGFLAEESRLDNGNLRCL